MNKQSTDHGWFSRRSAFRLYVLSALVFAGVMALIGMIPVDSERTAIICRSFGSLAILQVTRYIFNLYREIFPHFPLAIWTGGGLFCTVAVFYALIFTLPLYFFFRSRSHCLLAAEVLALAIHMFFACFIVAPFWFH